MRIPFEHIEQFDKDFPQVTHFITTKYGGVSKDTYGELNMGEWNGDCEACVKTNRNLLCQTIDLPENRLFVPREVHGNEYIDIDEQFLAMDASDQKEAMGNCDALITNIKRTAVAITTADCVPVLAYDCKTNTIAAIHAGWRGLAQNIIGNTIDHMFKQYATKNENLRFIIGPCISAEHYEISEDTWIQLSANCNKEEKNAILLMKKGEKYYPNLYELAEIQISKYAKPEQIYGLKADTYTDERFYSVRRSGQTTGRFLTGIFIK